MGQQRSSKCNLCQIRRKRKTFLTQLSTSAESLLELVVIVRFPYHWMKIYLSSLFKFRWEFVARIVRKFPSKVLLSAIFFFFRKRLVELMWLPTSDGIIKEEQAAILNLVRNKYLLLASSFNNNRNQFWLLLKKLMRHISAV